MKKISIMIIAIFILTIPSIIKAEEVLSETVKYYKTVTLLNPLEASNDNNYYPSITTEVSEEEYNNSDNLIQRDVTVETTYKKLTVSISKFNADYYRYRAILNWKQMPSTRSYDVLGIGHYTSVQVSGNANFEEYYCLSGGSCYTNTS